METTYYDENLKPLENPSLEDSLIEMREVDGVAYPVLVPLGAEELEAREKARASLMASPTIEACEEAIAELATLVESLTEQAEGGGE